MLFFCLCNDTNSLGNKILFSFHYIGLNACVQSDRRITVALSDSFRIKLSIQKRDRVDAAKQQEKQANRTRNYYVQNFVTVHWHRGAPVT